MSGLHKRDGTFLYVSEGAVGWGPRMRLLSTTEYTHIILRSPEVGWSHSFCRVTSNILVVYPKVHGIFATARAYPKVVK